MARQAGGGQRRRVGPGWAQRLGRDVGASIAQVTRSAGDRGVGRTVLHVSAWTGVAARGRRLAQNGQRVVGALLLRVLVWEVGIGWAQQALEPHKEESAAAHAHAGAEVGVLRAHAVGEARRAGRGDGVLGELRDSSALAIRVSCAVGALICDGVQRLAAGAVIGGCQSGQK